MFRNYVTLFTHARALSAMLRNHDLTKRRFQQDHNRQEPIFSRGKLSLSLAAIALAATECKKLWPKSSLQALEDENESENDSENESENENESESESEVSENDAIETETVDIDDEEEVVMILSEEQGAGGDDGKKEPGANIAKRDKPTREEKKQKLLKKAPRTSRKISAKTFRARKIAEYENRLRQFSTPDKIFRYFATLRIPDNHGGSDIVMTPTDFLRSIYPGMRQPEGLGLDRYQHYDPNTQQMQLGVSENSIFYKISHNGLITFSDFIFLLTVLSISEHSFEIAFRMFDLNGDGTVDSWEFELVNSLLRSRTGAINSGPVNFKGLNAKLIKYFFGPNLSEKLTICKFIAFHRELHNEILRMEFDCQRLNNDSEKISEHGFAHILLAYAKISEKTRQEKIERVKNKFRGEQPGIDINEYMDFFRFLKDLKTVDTAMAFYRLVGAGIDQKTLKHVAKTVVGVDLTDQVINVLFALFDENNDNLLSNREFSKIMRDRLGRGLEKKKDLGFVNFLRAVWHCALDTKPYLHMVRRDRY